MCPTDFSAPADQALDHAGPTVHLVAETVVRHARCPVLVARSKA